MRYLISLLVLASAAWAQTETYGHTANAATKIDMSAALSSRPVPEKSSDPGTCTEGMRYYNTTTHKGRLCTGTNTWADEASAGSGNMAVTSVTADPSGACTAGQQWQLRTDTTPKVLWFCDSASGWQKVLSTSGTGQFAATGTTGAALSTPAASTMGMWFDSTSLTLYAINENGVKSTTVVPSATRTANQFVTHIPSTGIPATAAIQAADVPTLNQSTTGNAATATALAANGSNCSAGSFPLGVDASGAAESCTAAVTTSTSDTFTNKTIDAEGTGNVITLSSKIWLPAAGCAGTTGTLMWDTLASNAPTATCAAGSTETTMMRGTADFPDSDNTYSLQQIIMLPDDWAGNVDVKFLWQAAATTGDVVWQVATSCRADAEVNDAAYNTANTVTDAAKGTTLQLNTASITGITMTGCAAGELMHLKVMRDRGHASDTITGVVSLVGVEVTTRRAM
jgi:hypothetical protein